jgi:hypothetical protein
MHDRDPHRGARRAHHAEPAQALNALTYDMCLPSRRRSTPGPPTTRRAAPVIDAEGRQGLLRGRRHRRDVRDRHARAITTMAAGSGGRIPDEREALQLPQAGGELPAGLHHGRRRRRRLPRLAPDRLRDSQHRHARMRHRPGAGCGRLADPGARAGAAGRISRRHRRRGWGRATRSTRALPITTCP